MTAQKLAPQLFNPPSAENFRRAPPVSDGKTRKETLVNSVLRANRCVAAVLKPLRTTKYARALRSSRLALHPAKPNFSALPELTRASEKIRRKRFADRFEKHPCPLFLPSLPRLAKTSRPARRLP
jgi:hypothetical protein